MTQVTKEWSIFHTKWRPLSASVDGPTMVARATSHRTTYHVSFVSQLNRQDQIKLDSKNIFLRKGQWPAAPKLYAFYDKRCWSIIQCMNDVSHYKSYEVITEVMILYSGMWRREVWKKVTNYGGISNPASIFRIEERKQQVPQKTLNGVPSQTWYTPFQIKGGMQTQVVWEQGVEDVIGWGKLQR